MSKPKQFLNWSVFAVVILFFVWNNNRPRYEAEEAAKESAQVIPKVDKVDEEVKSLSHSINTLNVQVSQLQKSVALTLAALSDIQHNNDLMSVASKYEVGFVVSDRNREIQMWSEGATKVFGYTREEATGMVVDELMEESERYQHKAYYDKGMRDGSGHAHAIDCGSALHKDGSVFSIHLIMLTPPDADWALAIFWRLPEVRDIRGIGGRGLEREVTQVIQENDVMDELGKILKRLNDSGVIQALPTN